MVPNAPEPIKILEKRLSETTNPVERTDILNRLSWMNRYTDPKRSQEYSREAISLSEKYSYPKGKAYGVLYFSICNFLLSNDENLLEKAISSLQYFESADDKTGQAIALGFIGNLYDNYGEYENGLKYCFKSLKIAESIDYKEGEATVLSTLGLIYSRLADYRNAIDSFKKSLALRETMGDRNAAASSLNLIARTYSLMGAFEQAKSFYEQSLKLREEIKDFASLSWTYLGLASLFERMKDYEAAIEHYQKSLELNVKFEDKRCELHCLLGLGKIFNSTGNDITAKKYLLNALLIAESLKAKPLVFEAHKALAEVFEKEGDSLQALEHFKHYHDIKEEVMNADLSNRLKQQQISFAVERSEKEAEIYRLRNVELKEANDIIEEKNRDITASIQYAQQIQNAMLPVLSDVYNALPQSFILFKPKDIVSGDFYWFAEKTEKATVKDSAILPKSANTKLRTAAANCQLILVAAADCTGHGVPGAFMSALGIEKLNEASRLTGDVSVILSLVNISMKKALRQSGKEHDTKDGMDIALISLSPAPSPGKQVTMQYAGANRPLWIINSNRKVWPKEAAPFGDNSCGAEIKATKTAIGGFTEDHQLFEKAEVVLQKDDSLYIFSDGYADQFGENGKKLMTRKFKEILLSIQQKSMHEQQVYLDETHKNWMGNSTQTDDVLVVGIRI